MTRESTLAARVARALRGVGAHAVRIESSAGPGVPDLNICWGGREAWVEFKRLEAWPARERTPVNLGVRPEQRAWMDARTAAGGRCGLVVQAGDEVLVLPWRVARAPLTRGELAAGASYHARRVLNAPMLLEALLR